MSFEQGYSAGYEVGAAIAKAIKIVLYIAIPYIFYKWWKRKNLKKPEAPEA